MTQITVLPNHSRYYVTWICLPCHGLPCTVLLRVRRFQVLRGGLLAQLGRRVMSSRVTTALLVVVLALCGPGLGGGRADGSDGGAGPAALGYAACIAMPVSREAWIREPIGSAPGSEPGQGWSAPIVLEQGMMIKPGARVTTGPRGQVLLSFADGSIATIGPNSDLVIGPRSLQSYPVEGSIVESDGGKLLSLAPPQIRLIIGRIWLEIAKRIDSGPSFEIETPSSTVSVRGTVFTVEVDEEQTTYVYVESGQVEVASESGSLVVDSGQSAVAQKGKRPEAAPEPGPGGKPSWKETGVGKPGKGPKDKEDPRNKIRPGRNNEEDEEDRDEDLDDDDNLDDDLDKDDDDDETGGCRGNGRRSAG